MNQADATWRPFGEPLSATLKRTVGLALIVGVVVAGVRQKPGSFAPIVVLALWFTFGGHWVELLFLNGLRPRIPRSPVIQVIARLLTWFLGGTFLTLGMEATALLIGES